MSHNGKTIAEVYVEEFVVDKYLDSFYSSVDLGVTFILDNLHRTFESGKLLI